MKFTKDFRGVPVGAIYPVEYKPGDSCPLELMAAAAELGAIEQQGGSASAAEAKPKGKAKAKAAQPPAGPADPAEVEVPANANPDH